MIEVTNLTKNYGDNRGVSDISFKIQEGEIVGFLGPNGAGKTTTMNILTGYLSATSGVAKVAGIDVLEDPIAAKKHIGYLPEQPPLYVDMTVDEYLGFVYELKKAQTPSRRKHIDAIGERVGLQDVRGRVIKNLSKGYRQRVGLAAALIGDPDVLILDEPTVGLDPKQIIEIRNLIKGLGKSRTIILSTHILPEVSMICERVLVINQGVIIADDRPGNLASLVSSERRMILRVAGPKENVLQALRGVDGVKSADVLGVMENDSVDFLIEAQAGIDVRKPIFRSLANANWPILRLAPQDMSLEDIFVRLIDEDKKS
jgi:ABC-2 type transport system ATP-binding protein